MIRFASEVFRQGWRLSLRKSDHLGSPTSRTFLAVFRELAVNFFQFRDRTAKSTIDSNKSLRKFLQFGTSREFHTSLHLGSFVTARRTCVGSR
jgi:hypothetical protein